MSRNNHDSWHMVDAYLNRWGLTKDLVLELAVPIQKAASGDPTLLKKTRSFYDATTRHISVESDGFYELLITFHQDNPLALKMIDFLISDLKQLRILLFIFGEQYLSDMPVRNRRGLVIDLLALLEKVMQRIALEESHLVPLLKQMEKVDCQA